MEAHLKALIGILSLTCLLQPALSDRKSKLVVKVPHKIKHIHINHFKPVHVHTMESKKFVYHHHEDEVTHKGLEGKHEEKGSFSNIKPIVWQPGSQLEALKGQEGILPFALENEPNRHYKKRTNKSNHKIFKLPKSNKKDSWSVPVHIFQTGPSDEDSDIATSNQDWRYDGDMPRKKNHGFSRGFRQSKGKNNNSKFKHVGLNHDESEWKPMLHFQDWRDFNDDKNNSKRHHGDHYFDSDKYDEQDNDEGNTYSKTYADFKNTEKAEQQRNSQKKIKGSRTNQSQHNFKKENIFLPQGGIAHKQPLSNLGDDLHYLLHPSSLKYLKDALLKDIETKNPQTTNFQLKPSLNKDQQVHQLKSQVHQQQVKVKFAPPQIKQQELLQNKKKHLQLEVHQQAHQQQQSRLQAPQQERHQQNIHQQIHHHKQNTQQQAHQQQSVHGQVLPVPVQGFSIIHKPHPVQKSPLSSSSLVKPHAQQQVSPVHVAPQQGKVKQQWHQTVQTSGKDGTGSSYSFEVVNYSPTEKVTPLG